MSVVQEQVLVEDLGGQLEDYAEIDERYDHQKHPRVGCSLNGA